MISLVDFVKAFNTNLKYHIVFFARGRGGTLSGSKNEFLEKVQNASWLDKYYFKYAHFGFESEWDEDNKKINILKDDCVLFICMEMLKYKRNLKLPIKLDDFTINDLKEFEKELNYVKNFKINNIITENNIVKSFNVEKCE